MFFAGDFRRECFDWQRSPRRQHDAVPHPTLPSNRPDANHKSFNQPRGPRIWCVQLEAIERSASIRERQKPARLGSRREYGKAVLARVTLASQLFADAGRLAAGHHHVRERGSIVGKVLSLWQGICPLPAEKQPQYLVERVRGPAEAGSCLDRNGCTPHETTFIQCPILLSNRCFMNSATAVADASSVDSIPASVRTQTSFARWNRNSA